MGTTSSSNFFIYLTLTSWSLIFFPLCCSSQQLHTSQLGALLQIRKHLEYPTQLEIWNTQKYSICYLTPTLQMNITCSNTVVTELRITGSNNNKQQQQSSSKTFDGYPIPDQTLSPKFSIDSLFTTVTRLSSLKVLSLVSLGIWGPIPDKISRLTSLEYLDLSSNYIFGEVPPTVQHMASLGVLTLDGNFLNHTVPDWLGSSNLTVLSLTNNKLNGAFPAISGGHRLATLALSNNQISGQFPDLSRLTSLQVVDLGGNRFDSAPVVAAFPPGLIMAFLSNCCSLTGELVSSVFDRLSELEHLDLSLNQLGGDLPVTLFSLPKLSYLNLASNSLTGSLPYNMSCGGNLGYVDLSNNRLTGEGGIPGCLSKKYVNLFGNCLDHVQHQQQQHPKSYCEVGGVHKRGRGRRSSPSPSASVKMRVVILLCVVGGIMISMTVLAFVFLRTCRKYCPRGCSEQYLLHKQVQENSITTTTPKLLVDAAKAVHFLHTGVIPGFFNNRLKMHNILIDENGTAKISDYGLSYEIQPPSLLIKNSQILMDRRTKMLEDDIHGFGFILLESLLGPSSITTIENTRLLTELASLGSPEGRRRMVDPLVLATSSQESLSTVIAITNRCLSCDSTLTRPSFEDVLWNLQYAAQVQSATDDPPPPPPQS